MAYVDLNPIRAGIATTPEASDFTSIYNRTWALKHASGPHTQPPVPLLPFRNFEGGASCHPGIPFAFRDYLELVCGTGQGTTEGFLSTTYAFPGT